MSLPPKLEFNEGALTEEHCATELSSNDLTDKRSNFELLASNWRSFYEIDGTVTELLTIYADLRRRRGEGTILFKVALQFPDYFLEDAPQVCFLIEELLLVRLTPSGVENVEGVEVSVICFGSEKNDNPYNV